MNRDNFGSADSSFDLLIHFSYEDFQINRSFLQKGPIFLPLLRVAQSSSSLSLPHAGYEAVRRDKFLRQLC